MSASHLCSSALHSVAHSDGVVVLGEGTDASARSQIEPYIIERLRNGESLGRVAQSLMFIEHADLPSAQRAVDEFASSSLNGRSNSPEIVPAGVANLPCCQVDELVVKQDAIITGLLICKEALPDLAYGGYDKCR